MIATPVIVMIAAWLIGTYLLVNVAGGLLIALAVGAVVSIAYILFASRRG